MRAGAEQAMVELAQLCVREAHDHVRRQRSIIRRLARTGAPIAMAVDLMEVFVTNLQSHREQLRRVRAEIVASAERRPTDVLADAEG
jgi:hypothetical protein